MQQSLTYRNQRLVDYRERGETESELARRFGITKQRVSVILKRHAPSLRGRKAAQPDLYKLARKHGLSLRKDRARTVNLDHQGGYMLIDPFHNTIVAGQRFDLDVNDVRDWLAGVGA